MLVESNSGPESYELNDLRIAPVQYHPFGYHSTAASALEASSGKSRRKFHSRLNHHSVKPAEWLHARSPREIQAIASIVENWFVCVFAVQTVPEALASMKILQWFLQWLLQWMETRKRKELQIAGFFFTFLIFSLLFLIYFRLLFVPCFLNTKLHKTKETFLSVAL